MLYRKGEHIIRTENSPSAHVRRGCVGIVQENQVYNKSFVRISITDVMGQTIRDYIANNDFIERLEIYKE